MKFGYTIDELNKQVNKLLNLIDQGDWTILKPYTLGWVTIEVTLVDIPNKRYMYKIVSPSNSFSHIVIDK